jgi:hypothetical protein
MQMRPELQIQSMIKALTDVVLPAVDPNNKLAQEQSRLVVGMLALMARQLPLQFRFDCDELARHLELARELRAQASGGASTNEANASLAAAMDAATTVLEHAKVDPADVDRALRALRTANGALISAVYRDGEPASVTRVERTALASTKQQLLRDRAFLITQNWEPDPKAIPAIDELLA